MNDERDLPPELEQLAARLRELPSPASELRGRVLGEVRRELRREAAGSAWWYAGAVAASVLLLLNLSMSAARVTDFHLRPAARPPADARAVARIQQLAPELSPQEARRQAALLSVDLQFAYAPPVAEVAGLPAVWKSGQRSAISNQLFPTADR
jgi:hypothetical protein